MTGLPAIDPWLACLRPRPHAAVRLFCFPYAGGGASVFRSWPDTLPASVEVCPVQLPGRETRFREPPFTRVGPLAEALGRALRPLLDRPFALFGHSMGALVAFELARWLRRAGGPQPVHLFASGCAAPHARACEAPIHTLPDAAFRDELCRLGGTPAAVLHNVELMELLLPTLRADFAACETYAYADGPRLGCPVTALGGLGDDSVSRQQLEAWAEQTTGRFRLRMLPGDHFFLQPSQALLLQGLGQDLLRTGDTPQAARSAPARPPLWRPAAPPPLGGSDVHVWRVPLDQPEDCRCGLQQYLDEDERERERRFHFPTDRERFVVCRGALRVLLGRYLSCHPGRLRFDYGPYGKPALADEAVADGLRFNVAHSEGLALIAVARDREVGVDLEHVRPGMATEQIALRFFSPREVEALRAVPPQIRTEAFFHCWTRKEAYLKATGTGLATALDGFDVSLAPGEPAALLGSRDDPREARRWSLKELVPGPDFVGALAVEGTPWRLWLGEWSEAALPPAPQARGPAEARDAPPQWPAFTPAGGTGRRSRRGNPVAAARPREEGTP